MLLLKKKNGQKFRLMVIKYIVLLLDLKIYKKIDFFDVFV